MDIPAPTKEAEATKIAVTKTSSTTTPTEPVTDPTPPSNTAQKASDKATEAEEKGKKIAELITSKKYHLAIKEKRTRPLLTFSILPQKKKTATKKSLSTSP
jgi:hypothetical protein